MDWPSRIKRMYEKYEPGKVGQVGALLQKYAGKEQALMDALVKKYGAEPAGGGGAGEAPVAMDWPSRVKRMYEKYEPAKVGQVDALMAKYKGKEQALMDALVKKYGPEPVPEGGDAPADDWRSRITRMYNKYEPAKVGQVDALLAKYAGKEQQLMEALVKKYGPEPGAPGGSRGPDYEGRVRRMYEKYEPAKAGQAAQLLQKYSGREEQLIEALVKKYGPEPPRPGGQRAPLTWVERFRAMYAKYQPDKVGTVAQLAEKYKGQEAEVMKKLVQKYGPEPPPPEGDDEGDADPRAVQRRKDRREWAALPEGLRAAQEEERDGRWAAEDEEEAARKAAAEAEPAARKAARREGAARTLTTATCLSVQRLHYRKWLQFLKERIRAQRRAQRELLDQRMSVYDQLQTNRHSMRYYEQMEERRQQEALRRQRRFEQQISQAARRSRSPGRRAPPEHEVDFVALNIRTCSRSPSRSPRADRSRRRASPLSASQRGAGDGEPPEPREPSPAAILRVRAYQRKWLPPSATPPEYPSSQLAPSPRRRSRSAMALPPELSPLRQRAGALSPPPSAPPKRRTPRFGRTSQARSRGDLSVEGQLARRVGEAMRAEEQRYPTADSELFARALQSATGTPETEVERALRAQRSAASGRQPPAEWDPEEAAPAGGHPPEAAWPRGYSAPPPPPATAAAYHARAVHPPLPPPWGPDAGAGWELGGPLPPPGLGGPDSPLAHWGAGPRPAAYPHAYGGAGVAGPRRREPPPEQRRWGAGRSLSPASTRRT
eukprot:TRINITY_DN215_c0_g2_i1.p1 TRINITY_DN215_c0_g2~~TRINITY_DN215_c0_g2_i1.p1  ORF type:complete len:821 (+),score=279.39 TRINITY_DN215_c0_g2_i1:145-2463(+)